MLSKEEMWQTFCLVNNFDINTKHDSFKFCGGGPIGNKLANLVKDGVKTATSSAKLGYDIENKPLPQVGDLSIVLYDDGSPACIIKETNVSIVPFNKVGSQHAYKEGEGNKSLKQWQELHRDFFSLEYKEYGSTFDENADCVLEEFEVVYK